LGPYHHRRLCMERTSSGPPSAVTLGWRCGYSHRQRRSTLVGQA
jgi:hypothetical protein